MTKCIVAFLAGSILTSLFFMMLPIKAESQFDQQIKRKNAQGIHIFIGQSEDVEIAERICVFDTKVEENIEKGKWDEWCVFVCKDKQDAIETRNDILNKLGGCKPCQ